MQRLKIPLAPTRKLLIGVLMDFLLAGLRACLSGKMERISDKSDVSVLPGS